MRAFLVMIMMSLLGCTERQPDDPEWLSQNGTRDEKKHFMMKTAYGGGSDAAKVVSRFLSDEDPEVQAFSCGYLGYLRAREYIPALRDRLASGNVMIANLAGTGLTDMLNSTDAYVLPALYANLKREELLVRLSAIEAIGSISSTDSTSILLERIEGEQPAAQLSIAFALGKIGDARALPALQKLLAVVKSQDHSVPNVGGVRGSVPHPDALQRVVENAISQISPDT